MSHEGALELERPHPHRPGTTPLDIEGLGGEPGLGKQGVQPITEACRGDDARPAWRRELVAEVVAERHEVDEVIGVEVADDDGQERARLQASREAGEGAWPRSRQTRSFPMATT